MAEFLTMQEAEDKFGKKGKTNAALTLGIIGTALGAFSGNNGCGNNGILGGLFGGNNGNCLAERAMQTAMAQGEMSQNLAWNNRVQSLQDDIDLYTYINGRNLAINERIGNETQILTNQIWKGRVEDLQEKSGMYVDIITRDNAQNLRLCDELYKRREQDVQEKTDIFERLSTRINELEKKEAAENLLATIRKSKEYIQSQIKAKEEKVNTLLELMESDPEMKKRFDELMMNKTAK